MNLRYKGIINIFTKFGKETLRIWFSGKRGEGECKLWHTNGQIWEHTFYKDGKLDGEYKEWDNNGQLVTHSFWKNGELDGEYKRWQPNGRIWKHAFYKNGKEVRSIK